MDFLELGSSPPYESCAQVGQPGYADQAREECKQYIRAIRTYLGPEPEGARLGIKWFDHEYGRYAEVVCYFDSDNQAAVDYAFACEAKGPCTWEDAGMKAPSRGRSR